MSLGIVIANIAGPVRQSPAPEPTGPPVAVGSDAVSATVNADHAATSAPALAPAISAAAPQLAANFSVVVLQLLNEHGVVTATIPSAQQLAAYKAGTATPPE